ncbi:hypothetical protein RHGRI_007089 [Rhododendron griersonianum]|uniref:Uncharacterized protein n=1 Tax=Rhododendron griersonianum TaxID=479676 RepID=A0AAV6KWP5_9ERIC|nr:hypothetical protein RHGRI_007089 [Rhododendron griersonianum]
MMMEADAHGGGNAATVDTTPQWCAFRLEWNGGSRRRQRLKSRERERGGRGRDGGAAEAHGGTGREGLGGSSMGLLQIWKMGHEAIAAATIDGYPITHPDFYVNSGVTVYGVKNVLDYPINKIRFENVQLPLKMMTPAATIAGE